MTVPVHIMMARKIASALAEHAPFAIDRRWFLYGSFYPDVSHYAITVPHFAHKSMGFVEKRIASLCRYHIRPGHPDPFFSMQLGILCHYLCDFFCHVHSRAFTGNKRRHAYYELRQQTLLMGHPGIIGRRNSATRVSGPLPRDAQDIIDALMAAQEAYDAAPHRLSTDMVLAVRVSSMVLSAVMCACYERAQERAGVLLPSLA